MIDLKKFILPCFVLITFGVFAHADLQNDTLPFQNITTYPTSYTSENMVVRMIDGLGFRFYWATDSLRNEDLSYRPMPEARSSEETVDHILGLSFLILNAVKNEPNLPLGSETPMLYQQKRKTILENLFKARQILASGEIKVDEIKLIFERKDGRTELPVWNLINGPIADALWHTGQLVTFRRSSGNPFNNKVNVLLGKLR
jgi:hypothetical protein